MATPPKTSPIAGGSRDIYFKEDIASNAKYSHECVRLFTALCPIAERLSAYNYEERQLAIIGSSDRDISILQEEALSQMSKIYDEMQSKGCHYASMKKNPPGLLRIVHWPSVVEGFRHFDSFVGSRK